MKYFAFSVAYYLAIGLIMSFTSLDLSGFDVTTWPEAGRLIFSVGYIVVLAWAYTESKTHPIPTDYNEDRDTGQDYSVND